MPARRLRAAVALPNIRPELNGASTRPLPEPPLSFLARFFGPPRDRLALRPLYTAVVARARDPSWYREGGVPDTLDGRFEMVTAVLALVLLRLEADGDAAADAAALLAETFVEDMDGTLRELGIGDVVVGRKVGKLMGALGGRLGAFRDGLRGGGDFDAAVARNVFRGAPASGAALACVAGGLRTLDARLGEAELANLLEGKLP